MFGIPAYWWKTGERKTRGQSSGCSFALHIPCAVPAMIVSSESSNVSKSAPNCRRSVVFPVGRSGCMYWSTDMWNMVTSWMNKGKLGFCPSFSTSCKCLAEMPSSSANSSLVIRCFSRAPLSPAPTPWSQRFLRLRSFFSPPVRIDFVLLYCTEMGVPLKRCEISTIKRFNFYRRGIKVHICIIDTVRLNGYTI